jgi:glycerol-3-phosphate dehydrogenase
VRVARQSSVLRADAARAALAVELPRDIAAPDQERLARRYGAGWRTRFAAAGYEASTRIVAGCEALTLEVQHAIRSEMALTLDDIVLRRLGLGQRGHPGADVLAGVAQVAARELGWDAAATMTAVAAVDAFYAANRRWVTG